MSNKPISWRSWSKSQLFDVLMRLIEDGDGYREADHSAHFDTR